MRSLAGVSLMTSSWHTGPRTGKSGAQNLAYIGHLKPLRAGRKGARRSVDRNPIDERGELVASDRAGRVGARRAPYHPVPVRRLTARTGPTACYSTQGANGLPPRRRTARGAPVRTPPQRFA